MLVAASAIEATTEPWTTRSKRAKWAVDLIAELRARAGEFEAYLEFTSLKTALTCGFTVVDIAATESLSSIVLEGRLS